MELKSDKLYFEKFPVIKGGFECLVNLIDSEFQIRPLEKKIDKKTAIMWGTYRSLINNAVNGVSSGHEKI